LSMHFLHDGRPDVVRQATWSPSSSICNLQFAICNLQSTDGTPTSASEDGEQLQIANCKLQIANSLTDTLKKILAAPNVCSKEWIIRQYDHEVQGGSVVKPLVGVADDGPGDAAVVAPVLGSWHGFAVGCGLNPRLGDLDPYQMAAHAIDEAVRNVVAVG